MSNHGNQLWQELTKQDIEWKKLNGEETKMLLINKTSIGWLHRNKKLAEALLGLKVGESITIKQKDIDRKMDSYNATRSFRGIGGEGRILVRKIRDDYVLLRSK